MRDRARVGLQRARALQSHDVGTHLGREAETQDEHGAHDKCQHRYDANRDELAVTLCAGQVHSRYSYYLGGSNRIEMRTGISTGLPLTISGS